ncbi:MAG: Rieske 2Fe-2S domain-containing protein [Acidimicrobiales bacterium]
MTGGSRRGTRSVDPWSLRQEDGSIAPGWALAPLRLFLGITFTYAGLQKLANPAFFRSSSPTSIHAQLAGAERSSPIHALLGGLVHVAPVVGAVIAIGEVAIGLGTLVGLWSRAAAAAGMVLSFGLFLTVSFHASPYFTGADIVFLFAWTPLLIAGAAGAPALDTWFAARRVPATTGPGQGDAPTVSRRDVVSKGAVTGILAGVVVILGGVVAGVGRAAGGTTTATGNTLGGGTTVPTTAGAPTTTTQTTAGAPAGTKLGPASDVPVGGSANFTDPASGDPALVIQATAGEFVAFDAVCPHAGCTVAYARSARLIACPCHGSEFDAQTGAVLQGPATRGLGTITVAKGSDGDLYVDG